MNYYAFQSTIALLRHLALTHREDEDYLERLSKVARYCGQLHVSVGVPRGDQLAMAMEILKELDFD